MTLHDQNRTVVRGTKILTTLMLVMTRVTDANWLTFSAKATVAGSLSGAARFAMRPLIGDAPESLEPDETTNRNAQGLLNGAGNRPHTNHRTCLRGAPDRVETGFT